MSEVVEAAAVTERQCRNCKQWKVLEQFSRNLSCIAGRMRQCSDCFNARKREARKRKRDGTVFPAGRRVIDMTGQKIGSWLVVEQAPSQSAEASWLCCCDCGDRAVFGGGRLRRRAPGCKSCKRPSSKNPPAPIAQDRVRKEALAQPAPVVPVLLRPRRVIPMPATGAAVYWTGPGKCRTCQSWGTFIAGACEHCGCVGTVDLSQLPERRVACG